MKFICLGYADMSQFATMEASELKQAMDACFDYDDILRAGGHFAGGEALQDSSSAVTLRLLNGQIQATDGPFAETKEQLGGILILEAESMEHAVALMSKHPGVRSGPFEIRPADENINSLIAQRQAACKTAPLVHANPQIDLLLGIFADHLLWLEQAVIDIPDDRMVEQPNGVRNHPAWTLSHVNASNGYLLKLLDEKEGASSDLEDKRFGNGSIPSKERAEYPAKEELVGTLQYRHRRVDAAVRAKHHEYFCKESPESLQSFSPTLERIIVYLLASHESYHLGQLMQWRRAAGLLDQ